MVTLVSSEKLDSLQALPSVGKMTTISDDMVFLGHIEIYLFA